MLEHKLFLAVGPYKRRVAGIAKLPDTLRLIMPTKPTHQQKLPLWEILCCSATISGESA